MYYVNGQKAIQKDDVLQIWACCAHRASVQKQASEWVYESAQKLIANNL